MMHGEKSKVDVERVDLKDACEHVLALVAYCKEHGLQVDACGCCDSPWITCVACNMKVIVGRVVGAGY